MGEIQALSSKIARNALSPSANSGRLSSLWSKLLILVSFDLEVIRGAAEAVILIRNDLGASDERTGKRNAKEPGTWFQL